MGNKKSTPKSGSGEGVDTGQKNDASYPSELKEEDFLNSNGKDKKSERKLRRESQQRRQSSRKKSVQDILVPQPPVTTPVQTVLPLKPILSTTVYQGENKPKQERQEQQKTKAEQQEQQKIKAERREQQHMRFDLTPQDQDKQQQHKPAQQEQQQEEQEERNPHRFVLTRTRSALPKRPREKPKFEEPEPPPIKYELFDEAALDMLRKVKCPAHLLPKGFRLKPAWDDSPPVVDSKPKLRRLPAPGSFDGNDSFNVVNSNDPFNVNSNDPFNVNSNGGQACRCCRCPTFYQYHVQTKMDPVNLEQGLNPTSISTRHSNLKMEGAKLDKDKSKQKTPEVDLNGNTATIQNSGRGENDVDVNRNVLGPSPNFGKTLLLKKTAPTAGRPGQAGTASSATSSSVYRSTAGKSQKHRSLVPSDWQRSAESRNSGGEAVTIFSGQGNRATSSEYYETTPPVSRPTAVSTKGSSKVKVVPRAVHSDQAGSQVTRLTNSHTSSPSTSIKVKPMMLEGTDPRDSTVDPLRQSFSEPPSVDQSKDGFHASDLPLEDCDDDTLLPQTASENQETLATPTPTTTATPTTAPTTAQKPSSSGSNASATTTSSKKSGSTASSSSKSTGKDSQYSAVSSYMTRKSAGLAPSQKPSTTPSGMDPCGPRARQNCCYYPAKTTGVIAPRVRLRDIDKKYTGQIASSDYANGIADDGSLNFGFSPRSDYGTQVTFSVEPKKAPLWKTMMRCGFVPVINVCCPPGQSNDMGETDSYDSYDSEYDSYDSSSSEGYSGSKNPGPSHNSSSTGSSSSKSTGSGSTKSTSSSKKSSSSSGKTKDKKGPQSEEFCETCGDDLTIEVAASGNDAATETVPDSAVTGKTGQTNAKTVERVDI